MASIEIIRVALTLTVTVSLERLQQEMGELVAAIGPNLAQEVDRYVREHKLGYYPALDFFNQEPGLDPNLLSAAEHVASLVCNFVRFEVRKQLREAFSNISFENMQSIAFSLPRVRPNAADALKQLSQHYSPNRVRLALISSSLEKAGISHQDYERLASHKLKRWLEEKFEVVDIADARLV